MGTVGSLGEVKNNFYCETEQESLWWKSIEEVSMSSYTTDNCFYECEQMALKLAEEGYFDSKQPLCCNFISWVDGLYSCDLLKGNVWKLEENSSSTQHQSSSAYIFDAKVI